MTTTVIGREEELDAVRAFLAEVEHGPAALVLSGEAGIGKTILWETGIEDAGERFAKVLTCRGVEAEASYAFAGLSELLAGVIGEAAPGLAPPRRRALEVALQLDEPGETPPDALVIGLALLDVLQSLAENGPVLVALDDVQWLDTASAAVSTSPCIDSGSKPVGLLATIRLSPDATSPLELGRSFPADRLTELALHPLSLGAPARAARAARRARADPRRAVPGTRCIGRQSVLRAGARPGARPHGHQADGRPRPADARKPAGAGRRPSRTFARVHR